MIAASQLKELLNLRTVPVAVTFRATPPSGVPRIASAAVSGCTYWKYAAEGQTFYTEASDQYNCPIGAYTHGIDLPPEQAKGLEELASTMVSLAYLRAEEIPAIPRRQEPFGVAIYAPLADASSDLDVVLVCGNPKQMMLLAEAAHAAGIGLDSRMFGRPTCAAIPEVLRSKRSVTNLGCIGNRVYTERGDDELYFALPGKQLEAVLEKLSAIVYANRELERYHRARAS